MKTLIKVLFLILLSRLAFAQQFEVPDNDTTTTTRATRAETKFYGGIPYRVQKNKSPRRLGFYDEIMAASSGGVQQVNSVAPTSGNVSLTSTNIPEGTNLYFTLARMRAGLSATGPITYNSTTGAFTFSGTGSDVGLGNVNNTSDANKPVSTAQQTAISAKENAITAGTTAQFFRGDKTFQTLNTTAVPEGTNLYYTDARSRLAESATAPLVYNSSTGVTTLPVATGSADGYLSAANFVTFNGKANVASTLAGYGITDAERFMSVASYAAMNAVTVAANTFIRVRVTADEVYNKNGTWYKVWAGADAVVHADKEVIISEK